MESTALDRSWRVLYRIAFQLARVWWFVRRPRVEGVFAAVWWGERLLLIRNSYRSGESAPGGRLGRRESPRAGAQRELREEVGLDFPEPHFEFAADFHLEVECTRDHVHFFELRLEEEPRVCVDRREVVWAEFVALEDLEQRPLSPHLRVYLAWRRGEEEAASPSR